MGYTCAINFFKFMLSTALFVIFVGPVLLVILPFLLYRTMVFIVLKLKFGSKFGSLISGADALLSADVNSKVAIINILMVVRTKMSFQEFFRKFKETIDTKIFQNDRHFSKFLSTRHKMGGYHYFIPNQVEINRCVRSFNFNCENEEMTKEELLKEISNYSNQPMPYNNTGFWEFLLCEKPVTWNNRTNQKQKSYALLLRFHHSLADGVTLMNFLLSIFSVSYQEKAAQAHHTQNNALGNKDITVRNILDFTFTLLSTPIVIISEIFFRHVETNSLYVPMLSDQHTFVAKMEESSDCMKIIKEIKLKVKDTSFIDILSFAISKSLSNYFQKKGTDSNLTCFNTYFTMLMNKASVLPIETKNIKMKNSFSYFNFNIPIVYNTTVPSSYWKSFMETLEKIKIETKYLRSSPDYKVTYGLLQAVTYIFPESIAVKLAIPPCLPLLVSNIPGPSAITLYGDCFIEDIIFWIPRVKPIGLTLGFFSYDKRLQIALSVDKVIISDRREAQNIADGIYEALIELGSNI